MSNHYSGLPDIAFWRRSMSGRSPTEVDPVTTPRFVIGRLDQVATAGSCFAQHISRTLVNLKFAYLVTEKAPPGRTSDEGYGVFPARFGNVYTVRQLLQLLRRAYGIFEPVDAMWQREDECWIDPFRPRIQKAGFATPEDLLANRELHFAAVREMFERCDVFVFTLGLTESWVCALDGAVFPIAPSVVSPFIDDSNYTFHNFTVAEVEADLLTFLDAFRSINPASRVILTVSPVALVATYEPRHVLVSTTYSKSVLRVAAETAARSRPNVDYFPSYEIITGPHGRGLFYEEDLREVRPEAVAHVMSLFAQHYLTEQPAPSAPQLRQVTALSNTDEQVRIRAIEEVICDEEVLGSAR